MIYDPSPGIGGPPSLVHLAAMHRQVEAHVVSSLPAPAAARRWGLLGWGLTVCVLLAVFGVLPELLSPGAPLAERRVDVRTATRR